MKYDGIKFHNMNVLTHIHAQTHTYTYIVLCIHMYINSNTCYYTVVKVELASIRIHLVLIMLCLWHNFYISNVG